jgi:hypothetical protein
MEMHSLLSFSEYAYGFDYLDVTVWQVFEEWLLSRRRTVQAEWPNRARGPFTIISPRSEIASASIFYTATIVSFLLVDCFSFFGEFVLHFHFACFLPCSTILLSRQSFERVPSGHRIFVMLSSFSDLSSSN